ncbi:MAG: MFS transporter [Nanoarchaeota archaeon]|nr:MFS transporter [Nanoarchaeota archaeon]
MGVLFRKQNGVARFTNIARLSFVGFLVSLAMTYSDTVWSIYLDSFVNSNVVVGFIAAFLTVVAFSASFFFVPIIERNDKRKLYSFSLFLFIIAYILFAFNRNFYLVIAISVFIMLLYSLKVASFGLLVRDNSSRKMLAPNEGVIYSFFNLSWVIGPLIAGYVFSDFGFRGVFLLSALFAMIGLVFFKFTKLKGRGEKKRIDGNMFKNFLAFFKDGRRTVAYFLGGGVNMWWALIYVFMPLKIIHSGLDGVWIGYFLFAVAVPLIFLEYYFSKLACRCGFKKIFKMGYFLVSLIALICFFVPNIFVVLSLLVLASVGVAMLEPTTEAYFFDILRGTEEYRFYGPYNTAVDFGSFIGKMFSSILLIFLPFQFIFLLFSALTFSLFLLSSRVRNIVECKRKSR